MAGQWVLSGFSPQVRDNHVIVEVNMFCFGFVSAVCFSTLVFLFGFEFHVGEDVCLDTSARRLFCDVKGLQPCPSLFGPTCCYHGNSKHSLMPRQFLWR